jgi:hypothetical protein
MKRVAPFQGLFLHISRISQLTRPPDKSKSHLSLKIPGKEGSPPWSPNKDPVEKDALFQSRSFTHPSGSSVKEPSNQVPLAEPPHRERRPVSRNLFYCLSKSTLNEPSLQVPQRGPFPEPSFTLRSEPRKQTKNKISPFSQRPRWTPPPHLNVPTTGPYGERGSVSTTSSLFIHSYLRDSSYGALPVAMILTGENGSTQR